MKASENMQSKQKPAKAIKGKETCKSNEKASRSNQEQATASKASKANNR